jgi:hypothetical protein
MNSEEGTSYRADGQFTLSEIRWWSRVRTRP